MTITDADVGDMIESATVTVQNALADDQLTLGDQAGFAITGSGTAIITIIGTGTVDQYEAIIQQIRFLNTGEDPTVGGTRLTRSINSVVNDGTSNSPTAITTVNITAINDEPTLTATGLTPTFTEGGAAVDLFDGVAASTIEAGGQRFDSLTLTVSNVTDGLTPGADEILTINGVDVALSNGNSVPLGGSAGTATVSLINNIATVTVSGADLLALAVADAGRRDHLPQHHRPESELGRSGDHHHRCGRHGLQRCLRTTTQRIPTSPPPSISRRPTTHRMRTSRRRPSGRSTRTWRLTSRTAACR